MSENNQTKSKNSNARGGARRGAGRKPGSATKKTRAIADKAAAEGSTPLEVMVQAMREFVAQAEAVEGDGKLKLLRSAADIAKDAAPYMHPRLASIEHTGENGGPLVVEVVKFSEIAGA